MNTNDTVVVGLVGNVLMITIEREDAMNAINQQVSDGIAQALLDADKNPEVRAILLTGAGHRVFSAGADLKSLQRGIPVVSTEGELAEYGLGGCTNKTSQVPLVIAANGSAYGGGFEMLLAADIVVVEEGSKFGLPEVSRGIIAAAGGVSRLSEKLPAAVANEILYASAMISAERGAELGLFTRVVRAGESLSTALVIANQIAGNAPQAVKETKRLAAGLVAGVARDFDEQQREVDVAFAKLLHTADAKEGVLAFVEKRAPVWKGE